MLIRLTRQIGKLSSQKPLPMGEVSALGAEVEGPLSHGLSRDSSPTGGAKVFPGIRKIPIYRGAG